jgi:putative oxidoreductase
MDTSSRAIRVAALLLRIALGGIFLYAAYTKLRLPWQIFAMGIDSYQVLPEWGSELAARTLPWAEVLIGLLLIAGRFLRIASGATSLLLMVFFGLMVRAYAKGMEIDCGCFGPGEQISWKTLLRDGSMLAGALFVTAVAFLDRRKRG